MPADMPSRPEEGILDAKALPPADGIVLQPGQGSSALPPVSELPSVLAPVALPVPRPGFGGALLWCLLFLLMTQVFPVFAITIVLMVGEVVANGLEVVSSPEMQVRLQERAILPALVISQMTGVLFSCLALWLMAGRDWARQVALRRPGFWHVLIALLGFPSLPILASGAYQIAKDFIPGIRELPAFFATQVVVLLLTWLVLRLSFGRDWALRLRTRRPAAQLGLVTAGLVVVLAVGIAVYQGWAYILPVIPYDGRPLMEEMVDMFRTWPWWLAVLAVGVGPGLSEELWCRGFLGRGLVGRYGVVLGVVLTSFLFGLIHGEPHQGTMAMLMGLVLHFSYLMTRSLWVPILLHFLNNALSVLATQLSFPEVESGETREGGNSLLEMIDKAPQDIPLLVYAAAALLMAAAGWALYRSRARLQSLHEAVPAWQPPFPGVAHPPPDSDTVVVHPAPGWLPSFAVLAAFLVFAVVFWLAAVGRLQ